MFVSSFVFRSFLKYSLVVAELGLLSPAELAASSGQFELLVPFPGGKRDKVCCTVPCSIF